MATPNEALDLLTAYRCEFELLIDKHCDPAHPEHWLAPAKRRDAYEGVRSSHELLEQCLCRLMGYGRAHEWLDPIARADDEFIKLATAFEPGASDRRRKQRIEHLRWHHETSDLPHDLDALQELLRASGNRTNFQNAKELEDAVGTAWASKSRLSEVCNKDVRGFVYRWYTKTLDARLKPLARQEVKEPGRGPKSEYKVAMLANDLLAHLNNTQ